MERTLLLVELTKLGKVEGTFYGVGYYSECGNFVFSFLLPDMFRVQPLRTIQSTDKCIEEIKIIGEIKKL